MASLRTWGSRAARRLVANRNPTVNKKVPRA